MTSVINILSSTVKLVIFALDKLTHVTAYKILHHLCQNLWFTKRLSAHFGGFLLVKLKMFSLNVFFYFNLTFLWNVNR